MAQVSEIKREAHLPKLQKMRLGFMRFVAVVGLSEHGFEARHEIVGLLSGEHQWRKQTEHVGAGCTGEHMLLVNEVDALLLDRVVKHNAYHESAAANFGYAALTHKSLEALEQVFAHTVSVLNEVLLLKDVEHGNGSGAAEVVAAKSGAKLAV